MGRVWVQVCAANAFARRPDLMAALEARPDRFRVVRLACLDRCTQCAAGAYALVNGTPVAARTPEELLAKIEAAPPLDLSPAPGDPGRAGPRGGRPGETGRRG